MSFEIDGATSITRDGNPIGLGRLNVGDFVFIRARQRNNGTLLAVEVRFRTDFSSTVRITDRVQSASPTELVVGGRRVTANARTSFEGVGSPHRLSDIQAGSLVTVIGTDDGSGVVVAQTIRVLSKT